MNSKRVKQIIGVGVIVVVIAGVIFMFTRLNKPAEPVQEMQTQPQFMTEETVDDPALVEEERKWEEVISSEEMTLKTITDTYLHVQPFSDTDTLVKVPMHSEFIEEATCFQGSVPLNWSKVTYNGVTGYVELCDTEYVLPEVEEELPEVPEEQEGVSDEEQHSIVTPKEDLTPTPEAEPTEGEEPTAEQEPTPTPEQTSTPETTPAPKEETPKAETPKAEAQPSPAPTQNPNVTTKTEEQKRVETQQSAIEHLKSLGGTTELPIDNSGFGGFEGTGKHYGDLQ